MLILPDIEPHKGMTLSDWAYDYVSQGCDKDITVNLHKNGLYKIGIIAFSQILEQIELQHRKTTKMAELVRFFKV